MTFIQSNEVLKLIDETCKKKSYYVFVQSMACGNLQ